MSLRLQDLLAPTPVAVFFDEHWQRKVLWGRSAHPAVRELVTLEDIEYLVSSLTTPGPNWIQVVKEGKPLALRSYSTGESFISLPKVYNAYRLGYTIQVAKMHKRWKPVADLCRSAETAFIEAGAALAGRIGSHLYLTPPGATGLEPHYDNHDVLVVQVQGTKRWKVYGALEEFPVDMQMGSVPRDRLPPLEHDAVLEAGQVLYIPRGIFHEATSEDRHSIHVTLDVTPYTWSDLAYRLMRERSSFREALPNGALSGAGAGPQLAGQLRERFAGLLSPGPLLDRVAVEMLVGFLDNLDPLPSRGLQQIHELETVGLETVVQRRPGSFAELIGSDGDLSLHFPGSGFKVPAGLEPVFHFLRDHDRFVVRDLPEPLPDEAKADLARQLIQEGLLEIGEPTA